MGYEALIQDEGRFGFAHLGVPRAGAADLDSYRLGARLVGNMPGAAAIEYLLGDVAVRAEVPITIAVTGAAGEIQIGGRAVARNVAHYVPAGTLLEIKPAAYGMRGYLSVRGGIDVPLVLGSRSHDSLAGLGPAALRAGDRVPIGSATAGCPAHADVVVDSISGDGVTDVDFAPGPREDCFTDVAIELLRTSTWQVSTEVNRVGARLTGPRLEHAGDVQIPSEAMHLGSIQVPASGQPIVFLANYPSTGGYPVIGVVTAASIPRLTQARPGSEVRFRRLP
ncbi:5-oxoprolinase subunit C family protein [Epidermidibacterium keratini]